VELAVNSQTKKATTMNDDEWRTILSYLPISQYPTLMTINSHFHLIMNERSFWNMMTNIYYKSLIRQEHTSNTSTDWLQVFKEYHTLRFSPIDCHPTLKLSEQNSVVENVHSTYFVPLRMQQPILKKKNTALEVTIVPLSATKVYGSSFGVVTSELLEKPLRGGFTSEVFEYIDPKNENSMPKSFPNICTSAVYLGHYYIPDGKTALFGVSEDSDSDVPKKYFNCGQFDNGYQSCCNGGKGYFNGWDSSCKIMMRVELWHETDTGEYGKIEYFYNGAPIGTPITGFFEPHAEWDYYVAFSVGRAYSYKMTAKYVTTEN
jgi:hypothetical protein